ncbi:hypothetical protein WA158_000324 [Blastocystis sp. Blastoise]
MSQEIDQNYLENQEGEYDESMDSSYAFQEKSFQIWYGINSLSAIVNPVAITMLLTSILVSVVRPSGFVESLQQGMNVYMVFKESTADVGTSIWQAVINALVMILGIGCLTFIIVLLYKYRCIKVLYGLLYFSTFSALGYTGGFITYMCFTQYKIRWDVISLIFVFYNFGVCGVIAIFYGYLPKLAVKAYLIIISVIVGYLLSFFPYVYIYSFYLIYIYSLSSLILFLHLYIYLYSLNILSYLYISSLSIYIYIYWTTWCLLLALALYDILAVLTPCGPLKLLVNIAKNRDDPIPGLLYEAELNTGNRGEISSQEIPSNLTQEQVHAIAVEKLRLEDQRNGIKPEQIKIIPQNAPLPSESAFSPAPTATPPATSANNGSSDINTNKITTFTNNINESNCVSQDGTQIDSENEEVINMEETEDYGAPSIFERESVHLGLGDFIFYSLLVTTAGYYSIVPYIACFVTIIAGLLITMALLSILEHALPALPFSMVLGVSMYFIVYYFCTDMINSFAVNGYLC